LDGLGEYTGKTMVVEFQNENLVAKLDGKTIASVPDLITLCDCLTGLSFATEEVKYGLRTTVLWIPAPELLCTERALQVVGPASFGYKDVEFTPLTKNVTVHSVFE
jgi:DUF917 family protein